MPAGRTPGITKYVGGGYRTFVLCSRLKPSQLMGIARLHNQSLLLFRAVMIKMPRNTKAEQNPHSLGGLGGDLASFLRIDMRASYTTDRCTTSPGFLIDEPCRPLCLPSAPSRGYPDLEKVAQATGAPDGLSLSGGAKITRDSGRGGRGSNVDVELGGRETWWRRHFGRRPVIAVSHDSNMGAPSHSARRLSQERPQGKTQQRQAKKHEGRGRRISTTTTTLKTGSGLVAPGSHCGVTPPRPAENQTISEGGIEPTRCTTRGRGQVGVRSQVGVIVQDQAELAPLPRDPLDVVEDGGKDGKLNNGVIDSKDCHSGVTHRSKSVRGSRVVPGSPG